MFCYAFWQQGNICFSSRSTMFHYAFWQQGNVLFQYKLMPLSEQDEMMAKELRDVFDHPNDDKVKEAEEEQCLEMEQDAEEAQHEAEVRTEQEAADVAG